MRAVNQFKTPEAGPAGSDIPSATQAPIAEESDEDEEVGYAGCEITENYLVSFRKPTPKIWVSETLSGFPKGSVESFQKPCLEIYRVSGRKPL